MIEDPLNEEISDNFIDHICYKYLTNWKRLRSRLGLTYAQEEAICKSYPSDYVQQKRQLLYTWKEEVGRGATYHVLIEAAETIRNQSLADNIRSLLEKKLTPTYTLLATSSSTSRLPHLQSVRSHPYATSSYKQKFLFRSKNVAREASKLQMHFVKVLGHTQRCFMEKESKDKDFRTEFSILLINLPISKRFKHLAFLEAKAKNIMAAESVSDIFIILRNHWNYTDYSLLDHLIDVFGNATMKEIMKKYKSDLEDFEKRTTVLQFQEARGNTKEPYINFGKVVAQLNVEPSQCTLWKVRCFIEHMKMEGSLEDYVGLILEIGAGSVLVTLALPQDGTLLVENLITVQFWATNFAESVTIDGEEILMIKEDEAHDGDKAKFDDSIPCENYEQDKEEMAVGEYNYVKTESKMVVSTLPHS